MRGRAHASRSRNGARHILRARGASLGLVAARAKGTDNGGAGDAATHTDYDDAPFGTGGGGKRKIRAANRPQTWCLFDRQTGVYRRSAAIGGDRRRVRGPFTYGRTVWSACADISLSHHNGAHGDGVCGGGGGGMRQPISPGFGARQTLFLLGWWHGARTVSSVMAVLERGRPFIKTNE